MKKTVIYKILHFIWMLMKRILSYISYIKYYIYKPKLTSNTENDIVISLTSYPERFKCLPLVIESIARQTLKPWKVILYLSAKQVPNLENKYLKKIIKRGVEVKIMPGDLRSHKKYFYSFKDYPNKVIITIDDDIIYDKNTIQDLYLSYKKHPTSISAKRVHQMVFDENNKVVPYVKWNYNTLDFIDEEKLDLVATGCAGILYPPHVIDKEVFNEKIIIKKILKADDLWLKIMELFKGTPVVLAKSKNYKLKHIWGTDMNGLAVENIGKDGNDIQLNNIIEHYKIDLYQIVYGGKK